MLPAEKDSLFNVKLHTLLKTQGPKQAAFIPLGWIREQPRDICVGNSMICSDIWHKYHKWYFEIVIRNFETILKYQA